MSAEKKRQRRGLPHGYMRIALDPRGTRHSLTVPAWAGRLIGGEQVFKFELTEEGMLFRAVDPPTLEERAAALPEWIKGVE